MPVGFKMFGQPPLFHIPLAYVAECFLLIIYFVTLLLFVQTFNTYSIHSIELVTLFVFVHFVHFLLSILLYFSFSSCLADVARGSVLTEVEAVRAKCSTQRITDGGWANGRPQTASSLRVHIECSLSIGNVFQMIDTLLLFFLF